MTRNIIIIGASAGGVEAVPRLLGSLSPKIKTAFFVTVHVPPYAKSILPTLIAKNGQLPAEHPKEKSETTGRKVGNRLFQARIAENLKHAKALRNILERVGGY